jgi:hypothetical protein
MAAPQAKFEFVATGDAAVNAQIQGVVDKLVKMKQSATEAGKAGSEGMLSAKEDVRALGEALDTKIPRPLASVISQFQNLQGILKGAGVAGAIGLAAETAVHLYERGRDIYDKWLNVNTAVNEYNKLLGEAVTKSAGMASSIAESANNLKFVNDQAKQFDDKQFALSLHNQKTNITQDPLDYFFSKSDEKDAAEGLAKSKLDSFNARKADIEQQFKMTEQLIAQQKELNDARLVGLAKILADEKSDNDLADAHLQKLQALNALSNEMRREFNAAGHPGAPGMVALIPDDSGQLEHSIALYHNQAMAVADLAKSAREAQTTIKGLNDLLSGAGRKATTELQDDPYQKQLHEVDDTWNKIIDDTERGTAEKFKILQQDGIDTTAYVQRLNATVLQLLQARTKAENDLLKKQQQELMSGGLKEGAIPSFLFVSDKEKQQANDAKTLIEQITKALQDERAEEDLIKDHAATSGETQIALEQELYNQRQKTANQVADLVDRLKKLGVAMHDGFGDPNVTAEANKLAAKIDDLRIKTQSWEKELRKTIMDDFQNGFVGIISQTESVSQAFQKMGQDILAELAKVVYQLYIVKLLQAGMSVLGGIFGGGGGPGASAGAGVGSTGSGLGSITSGIGSIFGGGRASGGPVLPGMSYMVGEHGPEPLIMGRAGGFILPNSSRATPLGMGGQSGVQVNIHNYGPPMDQQQTSHFDGQQYVVDVVIKDILSDGLIGQMMRK